MDIRVFDRGNGRTQNRYVMVVGETTYTIPDSLAPFWSGQWEKNEDMDREGAFPIRRCTEGTFPEIRVDDMPAFAQDLLRAIERECKKAED